jgi:hypothetical protein
MAQTPRTPDVEAQRAAMKKLGFLVGEWSGEASALRGPGQFAELTQISWGFSLGEFKTTTVLRINENGQWTEYGELVIGDRPPLKMMELKVRRSSC